MLNVKVVSNDDYSKLIEELGHKLEYAVLTSKSGFEIDVIRQHDLDNNNMQYTVNTTNAEDYIRHT